MKLIIGIFLALTVLLGSSHAMEVYAKGSSGGSRGGSFSGSRSSSVKSSTTTQSTSASKPATTAPKSTTPKVSTKPSSTTKTVTSSKPISKDGKTFSSKGKVTDSTYQPKFNGYTPPAGSTVYYRDSGMSWLPFYFLWMSSHREAVVQEPSKDGQPPVEKVVKEEGTDTMYVVNWIITILIGLGLIALVIYLLNRRKNAK